MFQVLGVASGCQFCSMKQLMELPLSKVRNYLLKEAVEKNIPMEKYELSLTVWHFVFFIAPSTLRAFTDSNS